jgi:hypothetical protein
VRAQKDTVDARLAAAPWPIFSSTSADRDATPIAGSVEMTIAFRMIVRSIFDAYPFTQFCPVREMKRASVIRQY